MIKPILCPICNKPAPGTSTSPFCSDRCRKVDLVRWCDGRYAIAEPLAGSPEELTMLAGDAELYGDPFDDNPE